MFKQLFLLILIFLTAQLSVAQSPCEPKPPAAVCDEIIVVAVDVNQESKIHSASFDDGSVSFTCASATLTYTVVRADLCDGDCDDASFGPSITVDNADLGKPFNVILRVTDALGASNDCMTVVKAVDKGTPSEEGNPTGGCTLACLNSLTASLSNNGTANIWPLDFLEATCAGKIILKIQDTDQNVIFEQTTENYWTATAADVDKPYVYTITHEATGNSCWGNITIVDKIGENGTENETIEDPDPEDHPESTCPDFAIDFSSYTIDEVVEFEGVSLSTVNSQLSSTYSKAFDDMIRNNGIDPAGNGYLVAFNIEDELFKLDNGDLKIIRTITLLDWCGFNPANGNNGIKQVIQVIKISGLSSMKVAEINYAESSTSVTVNEIFLQNDNGQVAMPAISEDESLSSSISKTLETAKWENGTYDISIDKYDACHNGVSSIDIVLVLRHILGLTVLDSNAKLVAADFDENGSVTAADLVNMRKTILGIADCNDDSKWRFFKNSLNGNDAFTLEALADHDLSYQIGQAENTDINIIALKKGDVNLSAVDKKTTKSKKTQLSTTNIELIKGNEYEIAFTATEDLEFVSGDFDFDLNASFEITGFSSDALDIEDYHFHVGSDKAKLLWYDEQNASFTAKDQVMTMHIRSNVNGKLSDILTPSMTDIEIYGSIDSKKSTRSQISFEDPKGTVNNLVSSYNIYMNNDQISVKANKGTTTKIKSLEVFNMTGQKVYSNMNVDQKEFNATLENNRTEILTYRILSDIGTLQVGKVFSY